MIDHVSLRVTDFEKARAFYQAALKPLGYSLSMEFPGYAGFGVDGKLDFWVTESQSPINPTHIAFHGDRHQVNAFFEAALAAGGRDTGAPGLRPDYHQSYYAAFVLDPDDNVVEVVDHRPEGEKTPASQRKPAKAKGKAKAKAKAKGRAAKASAQTGAKTTPTSKPGARGTHRGAKAQPAAASRKPAARKPGRSAPKAKPTKKKR